MASLGERQCFGWIVFGQREDGCEGEWLGVTGCPREDVVHVHDQAARRGGMQSCDNAVGERLAAVDKYLVDLGARQSRVRQGWKQQLGGQQVSDDDVVRAAPDRRRGWLRDGHWLAVSVIDDGVDLARGHVLDYRPNVSSELDAAPSAPQRGCVEIDEVQTCGAARESSERNRVAVPRADDCNPRTNVDVLIE